MNQSNAQQNIQRAPMGNMPFAVASDLEGGLALSRR